MHSDFHVNPLPTNKECHSCHPLWTIKPDHECDLRFGFGTCLAHFLAMGKTTPIAPFTLGSLLVCFAV